MANTIGASQTRLPPSPEALRGLMAAPSLDDDDWMLEGGAGHNHSNNHDKNTTRRLCSVARYSSFHPQALACSAPLRYDHHSYSNNSNQHNNHHPPTFAAAAVSGRASAAEDAASSLQQQQQQQRSARPPRSTSLGAVAGSDGVALFRVAQPHVPLLLLSHDAGAAATAGAVTSLRFRPPPPSSSSHSSLLLASARGSGVLIWDVSGHSLSPLQGRLAVDETSITSLTWKENDGNSGEESWLAATTSRSCCLWDLRTSIVRPSLRFGVINPAASKTNSSTSNSNSKAPSYLQIACSRQHECAILDAAGTVRVFDIRLTDRRTRLSTGGHLCQFQACHFAGVGLSFLPLAGTSSNNATTTTSQTPYCWVTWGLDAPHSDAVVKVWKSGEGVSGTNSGGGAAAATVAGTDADDYWYLDSSPNSKLSRKSAASVAAKSTTTNNNNTSSGSGYHLVGQCTQPNLACARVCPNPVENSIVTVGFDAGDGGGWRADLWKLDVSPSTESLESSLERIVTFRGSGSETEQANLKAVIGDDARYLQSLRASELAISTYAEAIPVSSGKEPSSSSASSPADYGLLLCCLTENGYVTTHASLIGFILFNPFFFITIFLLTVVVFLFAGHSGSLTRQTGCCCKHSFVLDGCGGARRETGGGGSSAEKISSRMGRIRHRRSDGVVPTGHVFSFD